MYSQYNAYEAEVQGPTSSIRSPAYDQAFETLLLSFLYAGGPSFLRIRHKLT